MQRLNLSSMLGRLNERTPTVVAAVNDMQVITPTLARVIVSFNTIQAKKDDLYNAVASIFEGKAAPVENSFRQIASNGSPSMHGFVRLNQEVRAYDESKMGKSMQAIASNMLMDTADNSLWQIQDGPGGKLMARQTEDNLTEILSNVRVHRHGIPVLASVASELAMDRREYAAFVNPETNEVNYGYVIATAEQDEDDNQEQATGDQVQILVNPSDNGGGNPIAERVADEGQEPELVVIDATLIVETAFMEEADADRFEGAGVELPTDSRSNEAMKAFYKELYAYDPSYYKMIEEQINEHASI